MDDKISRRGLLKKTLSGVASAALSRAVPSQESIDPPAGADVSAASPGPEKSSAVLPLTNTSNVFIPPRGNSFFKFSFDFPEPSVSFENLQFSFRVYTFENTYAPDASSMTAESAGDGVRLRSKGFVWAGDQQRA